MVFREKWCEKPVKVWENKTERREGEDVRWGGQAKEGGKEGTLSFFKEERKCGYCATYMYKKDKRIQMMWTQ